MAQAKRKQYVSKGQRQNSRLVHRPAKPVEGSQDNAMTCAMLGAKLTDNVRFSRLGAIIIKEVGKHVQHPPKQTHDQKRGWSAHLSFRTFKELQAQGVMA
jgi:hypothetical protein